MTEDTSSPPSETPKQLAASARERAPLGPWLASKLQPGEGSRLVRFLLWYGGVFAPWVLVFYSVLLLSLPAKSFAGASGREMTLHPWNIASDLLYGRPLACFLPLILFSLAAATLVLKNMDRFGRKLWVRWGLYTGVILSLHFWYLHGLVLTRAEAFIGAGSLVRLPCYAFGFVCVPVVGLAIFWAVWRRSRRLWQRMEPEVTLFLVPFVGFLGFVLMCLGGQSDEPWLPVLGFVLAIPLMLPLALVFALPYAAPSWALAVFVLLSIYVAQWYGGKQLRLWQFFLAFVWFGLYFTAWRLALS